MKKIILTIFLTLAMMFVLTGCTTPKIQESKFQKEYVNYNETPVINFNIYNPSDTSFDGMVQIQTVTSSGFFNCFNPASKNISTVLPKKSINGEIQIISLNDEKCKGETFEVYLTLKDANSGNVLAQKMLLLKILG